MNLLRHFSLQKYQALPWCSCESAVAGSTCIPHTGSFTRGALSPGMGDQAAGASMTTSVFTELAM